MDLTGHAKHWLKTASVLWDSSNEKFRSNFEKVCLPKYICVNAGIHPGWQYRGNLPWVLMEKNGWDDIPLHLKFVQKDVSWTFQTTEELEDRYSECTAWQQRYFNLFCSLSSLTKSWNKQIHWCSHPLTSAMSNVKHLLLVITTHLFEIFLVSWAKKPKNPDEITLNIFLLFCCFAYFDKRL